MELDLNLVKFFWAIFEISEICCGCLVYLARFGQKRRHRRTYLRGIGRGRSPLSQQKKRPLKKQRSQGKKLKGRVLLLITVSRTKAV